MARTKPGPAAKKDPTLPRTLSTLNLTQGVALFDARARAQAATQDATNSGIGKFLPLSLPSGAENNVSEVLGTSKNIATGCKQRSANLTRLDGSKKTIPGKLPAVSLKPRWGEIDPETEDSDDIIKLFEEWHQYQAENTRLVNGGRVVKAGVAGGIRKNRRSYPREYKLKALTLWRVGVVLRKPRNGEMRSQAPQRPEWERVSQNRAAQMLGICPKQLREWEKQEDLILNLKKGSREVTRIRRPRWPEMERFLYDQFKAARKIGRSITHHWFERKGKEIFADLYPEQVAFDENDHVVYDCCFSHMWFTGFKLRWDITWRCKTNIATLTPEELRPKISLFCKFNRRNSQLREGEEPSDIGRFPLGNMFNMDQTPFPFEFLRGRTYHFKGAKTIWEKALRASWTKRQATLQLTISGDGKNRCIPLLIFRGEGKGKAIRQETQQYDPRVRVIFNPKGYSNEAIILDWLKEDLIPALANSAKPRFIALDVFAGQKTPSVLNAFRASKTTTSFIPEGCTSLVQPLDTAVNRIFKDHISNLLDNEMDRNPDLWDSGRFTVGDRRILMTWIVGETWDWLHQEKSELIIKSFRQVGITLPIDGAQDSELMIKGLEDLEIGDWREGGLDCNLNTKGKTSAGELDWGKGMEMLDQEAIDATMVELENIDNGGGDGEYVSLDDVSST